MLGAYTPVELRWNCLEGWIRGLFIPCPLIGFASQYSNSLFASWARSRHIVSKAEKRFLESTRPLELILQNCNPLEGAGYLPFCNGPDSFVSVSTRDHLHGSDWPQLWPVRLYAYFRFVLIMIRQASQPSPALRPVFALAISLSF